ncbi:hypothetical protein [Nocardioides sp. URHA0020]|uniref:hypothetical protein n=1 Tax=Nocardioides sp. URHA0020 TaxID=1380392 RepID=UPI00048F21BE|nr:hypothetical protein [Nocardioides sp. URHA0020]
MLRYAAATLLLVTLVACGSDDPDDPRAERTPSATSATGPTDQPSDQPPSGGTVDAPLALDAATDLLDWQPVDGSVDDTVTRNEDWTLSVLDEGDQWKLSGPSAGGGGGSSGWRVSDALLDEDWAVVVLQDKTEEKPSRATVTELATGRSFTLDGRSDVPTVNGGTWALGDGRVLHATTDKGAYCLASVDLASRASEVAWCAPRRSGFNGARLGPGGDSLLTFDDGQPACRTVVTVADGAATPFADVADCTAWDGLAIEDGAIWSVIPDEQQVEEADLHARVGTGYFDLGPGTAGSLTWCDDAAYFTRDPQRDGDPATLLRWDPQDGLSVVYESPQGEAFVEAPRCGGDTITLTARTSSGDEQVTADL